RAERVAAIATDIDAAPSENGRRGHRRARRRRDRSRKIGREGLPRQRSHCQSNEYAPHRRLQSTAPAETTLVGARMLPPFGNILEKSWIGCQRRSKNASAGRSENTSVMPVRRPRKLGSFVRASGLDRIIYRRIRARTV